MPCRRSRSSHCWIGDQASERDVGLADAAQGIEHHQAFFPG
jgi:hypothetical protein